MVHCQYHACPHEEARYYIRWEEDGEVKGGRVCGTHDRYLGRQNIARAYGLTMTQAVDWDNRFLRGVA